MNKKFYIPRPKSQMHRVLKDEGKSIEEIIRNAGNNPNGIEESAPMIYTEKALGVQPEYDVRTDKQLLAIAATDKYSKSEYMQSDFGTYKQYKQWKEAEAKKASKNEPENAA